MNLFTAKSIVITATMWLNHPAEDIFPLLCPVKEYDWIECWQCEVLHTQSGINEPDCVFRTAFEGQDEEIWVTNRFEPPSRVEFIRTGPNKVIHFEIRLGPKNRGTELKWTQHIIGITETGNQQVENTNPKAFEQMVAKLQKELDTYLTTGEMYREPKPHENHR